MSEGATKMTGEPTRVELITVGEGEGEVIGSAATTMWESLVMCVDGETDCKVAALRGETLRGATTTSKVEGKGVWAP